MEDANERRLREDRERRDRMASTSSIAGTQVPQAPSLAQEKGFARDELQTGGGRAEDVPLTHGNKHLMMGVQPEDVEALRDAAPGASPASVGGPGTDNPNAGLTRTVGQEGSSAVEPIKQVGNTVILPEDTADTERPEFEPGRPKPRTDADADPHEVTTPGFQGFDRINPLPLPQPLNTIEHRGALNEPRVVGVQTVGGGEIEVVGSESERAKEVTGEAKPTEKFEGQGVDAKESAALKQGHLPEDFPGYSALQAAGEATYAKVRKRIVDGTLTEVSGIGDSTAERIEEAMAAVK